MKRFLKYGILKTSSMLPFLLGTSISTCSQHKSAGKGSDVWRCKAEERSGEVGACSLCADLIQEVVRQLPPVHRGRPPELPLGLLPPALRQQPAGRLRDEPAGQHAPEM